MLTDLQNKQRWESCYNLSANSGLEMREEYLGLLDPFMSWLKKEKVNLKNYKGLNAGCGSGANTLFLAEKGLNMISLDYSKRAINRATKLAEKAKLTDKVFYLVHDLTKKLPLKANSVDFVFDLFTTSSIKGELNRQAALTNMVSVLKKGGYLITFQFYIEYKPMVKEITDHPGDEPNSAFVSGKGPQIKLFSAEELLAFYKQRLTKVIFRKQDTAPRSVINSSQPVYLFGVFKK